jgi:hypothetical protein
VHFGLCLGTNKFGKTGIVLIKFKLHILNTRGAIYTFRRKILASADATDVCMLEIGTSGIGTRVLGEAWENEKLLD